MTRDNVRQVVGNGTQVFRTSDKLRSFDSKFGIFDSELKPNDSAMPFAAGQSVLTRGKLPATRNKLRSFDSNLLAADSQLDIFDSAKRRLRRSAGPLTIEEAEE